MSSVRRASGAGFAALAVLLFALVACEDKNKPVAPAVDASVEPSAVDAASPSDAGPGDAEIVDGTTDATAFADGGYAILERFSKKKVFHCGDSFVGGAGGLTKGLTPRFEGSGAKFWHDSQQSLFLHEARGEYLDKILAKNPDVVVLTIGANDVFIPHPEYLVPHIEAIAKKLKGKECYWLPPPLWKEDATGFLATVREHTGSCKVFDINATGIKIPRRNDGIHPTDEGGELWAAAFWQWLIEGTPEQDAGAPPAIDAGSSRPDASQ